MRTVRQQVGSLLARSQQALLFAPLGNPAVISTKEDVRHGHPPKFSRSGVLGIFQQSGLFK
jgi:hypothetical protein